MTRVRHSVGELPSLSETTQRVRAFFDSYRAAFEQLDAPAIAEHFAYPSHITSDQGEIALSPVASIQDWLVQIEQLLDGYRRLKFRSARVRSLEAAELSPSLLHAMVTWELHDDTGRLLYEFRAMYTLANIGDTLRIAAIAHNEIPQYLECLRRLQSERRPSS
jgi:hypothetical protein